MGAYHPNRPKPMAERERVLGVGPRLTTQVAFALDTLIALCHSNNITVRGVTRYNALTL